MKEEKRQKMEELKKKCDDEGDEEEELGLKMKEEGVQKQKRWEEGDKETTLKKQEDQGRW